ncbi:MAG: sulfatase-like hydrolase/transferase [Pirellulales bacterium]
MKSYLNNPGMRPVGFTVIAARMVMASIFAACGAAADAADTADTSTGSRPNILYIFTDDQSIRSVGCYPEAHDWVRTPNLDRLASEGVRFTTCYTGAWCQPSRATALTGRLQHGIHALSKKPPPGRIADSYWPTEFRKAGYHTGMIGKWHTGKDKGHGRAWDYSAIWDHTNGPVYGGYYVNQSIDFNGQRKKVDGYSTDNYTDWAVDYVKERAAKPDQPWYLWLCYDGVHHPFMPAERHEDEYPQTPLVPVPADIYPPRPDKPRYMRNFTVWKKLEDGQAKCIRRTPAHFGRTLTELVRQYNRAVRSIDEGVGRVLAALEQTGQLENTLVIFTSDQGYAWGQHGFAWKYAPYDDNLRAPLLVRYPKRFPRGAVCEEPVAGHDLIPTFFALADIELPWRMHGRDILPLLENPKSRLETPVMLENLRDYYGRDTDAGTGPGIDGVPWWIFLRKGKYKYIRTLVKDEVEELYDLDADPGELQNLAVRRENHKLLAQFREMLLAELRRTDAGLIDNLPPVKLVTNQEK